MLTTKYVGAYLFIASQAYVNNQIANIDKKTDS